jgi:3-deoxy-D-manno-octulosonate 8-phosphate phosphatase (KDO 8-P phosphatase)
MTNINFSKIKLLIMDVDGVLTDGGIIIHSDGTESKRFHVMDGHRVKMWQRAGLEAAILSGRDTEATTLRGRQLGIERILQGYKEKLPAFEELLSATGLSPEEVACVGDDLMDIPLVRRAGFGAAVANAAEELKQAADYVTSRSGGDGAVAEVIEVILKNTGRWDTLMQRYLI